MKKYNIYGYSFEELSPKTQQKVLDDMRYNSVDYIGWWRFTYEDIAENILPKYGIILEDAEQDINFKFDSYNRIVCSLNIAEREIDIKKFFELCNIKLPHQALWEKYNLYDYIAYKITKREFEIDLHTSKLLPYLEKCFDNIYKILNEKLKEILDEIEAAIKDEYEWLTSDENTKENIIANDYIFTEDGRILPAYAKEA